jgi:hypothetical protein
VIGSVPAFIPSESLLDQTTGNRALFPELHWDTRTFKSAPKQMASNGAQNRCAERRRVVVVAGRDSP